MEKVTQEIMNGIKTECKRIYNSGKGSFNASNLQAPFADEGSQHTASFTSPSLLTTRAKMS